MTKLRNLKKQMKKTKKKRGGCPCNKKNKVNSSWKLWGGKKTIDFTMDNRIIPL